MKKLDFCGIPRPNYLKELEISGNSFSGKVFFPLSDDSIGDRKDHANVSHLLFSCWNVAHFFARNLNMKKTLAVNTSVNCFSIVPPEKEILIKGEIRFFNNEKTRGKMSVTFFNEEKFLSDISVIFRSYF